MHPLLLLSLAVAVAVPPVPPVGTPPSILQGDLRITSSPCDFGDESWTCTFSVTSLDPALRLFRWDFDGDGTWDFPAQSGTILRSRFATATSVAHGFEEEPDRTTCVQGWDGASTKVDGGIVVPDGPVVCMELVLDADLDVRPHHWSHRARGRWVFVTLELPEDADAAKLDVNTVTLEGIRAILVSPHEDDGNREMKFRSDRAALTALLGVGEHVVHLRGAWAGGTFAAADEIEIR